MNALDRILAYKREEVAERRAARSEGDILAAARAAPPPRDFLGALRLGANQGYGLIAEIKRASPSAGLIREDFDPAALAGAYSRGGASCLSVLTDGPSFQGDDAFLGLAREACDLPVLRKDFVVDPWQVAESRALGADAVLLIVAALEDGVAAEVEAAAAEHGMAVLVEVHDEAELERAGRLSSPLVGINNRDLRSFVTDLGVTRRLVRMAPADRLIVSESGLSDAAQLADLARYGCRCFLVGEALMRHDDVAAATRTLLADPLTAGA
jgi:indole-3-glycerol phosphate synthase